MKRSLKIFSFALSIHILLLAFDASAQQPTQEWVRRYTVDTNDTRGVAVKLDAAKNIYVATSFITDTTFSDIGLLKYDPAGNLLWFAYYNTPDNRSEAPVAFDVSQTGDVYITARSNLNFIDKTITIKFNTSGILQWAHVYEFGVSSAPSDISIDRTGNIIVGGAVAINSNNAYAFLIKYNPSGDTLWTKQFTAYTRSIINDLVIDDSSNIYTAGYHRVSMTESNYLTLKYNSSGILKWSNSFGFALFGNIATSIAIDSNRNVYVVGTTGTSQGGYIDNTLIKLNPDNAVMQWASIYTGINGNHRLWIPTGVSVKSDGSAIYYTTVCGVQSAPSDFVTLAYNPAGDTLWTKRYPTGISGLPSEDPKVLKLDRDNNIYVIGYTSTSNVAIKYLSNGTQQWVITVDRSGAKDIIIDSSRIYITGTGTYNNIYNAATIKYNQPIGIHPNSNELPTNFKLFQNYPNPFNGTTIINYELPKRCFVELKIFDITGRVVKTIVSSEQSASYYTIYLNTENLSSGIYFYRLKADHNMIDTKKLILLK